MSNRHRLRINGHAAFRGAAMDDSRVERLRFEGKVDLWFNLITASYAVACALGVALVLLAGNRMPVVFLAVVAVIVVACFVVLAQQLCRTLRNYVELISGVGIVVAYGLKTLRIDADQVTAITVGRNRVSESGSAAKRVFLSLVSTSAYGEAWVFRSAASFDRILVAADDRSYEFSVKDKGGFLRAAAEQFPDAAVNQSQ